MSALELQVYELFKNRFSETEARLIVEYFEAKAEEKYQQKKDILATKQDVSEAKADIIKWSFVFWIGTVVTILGGLLAILKLFFNK